MSMEITKTILITILVMCIVTVILAGAFKKSLEDSDSIELIGTRLENSDPHIDDAVKHLKAVNRQNDF